MILIKKNFNNSKLFQIKIKHKFVIKSGSGIKKMNRFSKLSSSSIFSHFLLDFKELTIIDVEIGEKFFIKSIEKIQINMNVPENLEIKKIVDHHLGKKKL